MSLSGVLALLVLLLAVAFYRAFVVQATGINLFLDEAYYLGWSKALAFGYYSKPPMIAWTLAATGALCGEGELCVKAGGFFWYALAAVFVALTAARLFGRETGLWSGFALYTMPAVALLSLTASTDAPLLAFWALGLWAFLKALDERPGAWALVGVAIGLGMLSKYTMIAFPLSMLLYLLFSADRGWLRLPGPWLALALGLLIMLPNLWWNLQNGFPSIVHTAELTSWSDDADHLGDLLEFAGAQLGVFGLLSFPLLLVLCVLPGVWADPRRRLLLFFTLPLLLIYLGQAWLGGAYANWALAAYVAATPLLIGTLYGWGRLGGGLIVAVLVVNVAASLLLYHWPSLSPLFPEKLSHAADRGYSRVLGWREVGEQVLALRADHPQAELLGESRTVLAEMSYYARTKDFEWPGIAAWNPDGGIASQYELVADIASRSADEFLYVGTLPLASLAPWFDEASIVGTARHEIYVGRGPGQAEADRVLEVSVYHLRGFRGYDGAAAAPR